MSINKYWRVKKGNTSEQVIEVKDKDDALVLDLLSATSIKFQVKDKKTNAVEFEKTVGSGIQVDTPTTGYLTITLLPTDTDIRPKHYQMAIEAVWSSVKKYETRIYIDNIETYDFWVEQDTIQ